VLGKCSTGAASDLSGATELAIKMVKEWGLSPRLGPVGCGSDGPTCLSRPSLGQERCFPEGTQQIIDQEVSRLLSEAKHRADALLSRNRGDLQVLVVALVKKKTILGEELGELVGQTEKAGNGGRPNSSDAPSQGSGSTRQPDDTPRDLAMADVAGGD
jgi:cell division protease FtsH